MKLCKILNHWFNKQYKCRFCGKHVTELFFNNLKSIISSGTEIYDKKGQASITGCGVDFSRTQINSRVIIGDRAFRILRVENASTIYIQSE
jgi:hypothetical protein